MSALCLVEKVCHTGLSCLEQWPRNTYLNIVWKHKWAILHLFQALSKASLSLILQSMFLHKAISPFWRAVCSVEDASLSCIDSECGDANCEDKYTSGTQSCYNAARLDLSVPKRIPPFNQRSCQTDRHHDCSGKQAIESKPHPCIPRFAPSDTLCL